MMTDDSWPTKPTPSQSESGQPTSMLDHELRFGGIVINLRRRTADENELSDHLTKCGEELSKDGAAAFALSIVGEPKVLDSKVKDESERIACEALANAFRHSSASKIETELIYDSSVLRIRVRDDGVGIG